MGLNDASKSKDSTIKRVIKKVLNIADLTTLLTDLSGIIDPDDTEIIISRGKNCESLFISPKAKARMQVSSSEGHRSKIQYAAHFPQLCERCPNGGRAGGAEGEPYEIADASGRMYIVRYTKINWIDGEPATAIMLRDITQEKEAKERLFTLAYIDQLTRVPNRQKLKEDFNALEDDIANDAITGIVALFDLDHFKQVNDNYGHNTGDLILHRLTEHFESDPAFKGHIYRLGGDEFVLLYADPINRFADEEALKEHYQALLATSLKAYTLPNIEAKCTLSMGVSIYPRHGVSLSDILRKADIALYKAKAAGRNQVVFFEDRYDTAKKFKDMYINIRPVLYDYGKTFGYELVDSLSARAHEEGTVSLSEFNRTLDALGLGEIENKHQYFITYTEQLLNPAVLNNLPKDKFIVQMPLAAKQSKDELQRDIQVYNQLRKNGYRITLSGLDSASPATELLNLADYCKFSPADKNMPLQKKIISSHHKVRFIATDIDTHEAYLAAKDCGFSMFQGFYFNQPVVEKKSKEISPLKINYFRLLKLSSTGDYLNFREISDIISADVALSYKLLRMLNSAAVGLRNVSSINNAVTYMGEESLKKWIAVLALRGIAEDKPLELVRMSLIRARFGELLVPAFQEQRNAQHVFMVGMLSLIHIALEKTKEQLLEEIPVSDEIRQSLLTKNGIYSDLLDFYEDYEYANWEAVSQFVEANQLSSIFVNDSYIEATKWYNDLIDT